MTRGAAAAAGLAVFAFLIAYAPDTGHGFISDDFGWLLSAERIIEERSPSALLITTGFFRPLVTLSFALEWPTFGLNAAGYGFTNLLLVLLCAVLIYAVCRTQRLAVPAALVAAATWLFNFHGINMAILWLSGRTSVLLTFFSLLSAWYALTKHPWWAALWCGAALLAKEEAVALPMILLAWTGLRASWPSLLTFVPYFALRLQSDAFWPHGTPPYYQFTTDAAAIATNAAHYLDRAGTVFVAVALVVMIVSRARPRWGELPRDRLTRGLIWCAAGYAITLWIPVRSSLYAVFPSAGLALALGAVLDPLFAKMPPRVLWRTAVALVVLCFLALPVLRARNVRWVELADLSRQVMKDLEPHAAALRAGTPLWIVDDDSTRANIRNAFAAQLGTPVQLFFGARVETHVTVNEQEVPPAGALVLRLQNGRLK
jgi:hypothetical protein